MKRDGISALSQSRRETNLGVLAVVAIATMTILAAILAHIANPVYGGIVFWSGVALQLVATPVLLLWRRWPTLVVLTVSAVALLVVAPWPIATGRLFTFYNSINIWVPLVLTSVGGLVLPNLNGRRARVAWVAIGALTVLAARPWDPDLGVSASGVLHTAVPTLLGSYIAARRRLLRALRGRADRAERDQRLMADQARAEERTRLAAEMHDVVVHRVSLMVLQAGALLVTAADDATRRAAEELRAGGWQALEELRDVIGVLRGAPTDGSGAKVKRVEPSTPDITSLIAESASVGIAVELIQEGKPSLASPAVARAVYRVVQEALTNVHKHAPGASVRVSVHYERDRIRLTVRNGAPARKPDGVLTAAGSGTGLLGLQQRVDLLGGALESGPTRDGGFELSAVLPGYIPIPAEREAHGG